MENNFKKISNKIKTSKINNNKKDIKVSTDKSEKVKSTKKKSDKSKITNVTSKLNTDKKNIKVSVDKKVNLKKKINNLKIERKKILYGRGEYLNQNFVDNMYEYMWQFINVDTIKAILNNTKCNTAVITRKLTNYYDPTKIMTVGNTIIFEDIIGSDEGHYIYADQYGRQHGTYENQLIDENDDGICHGAAIYYALSNCGYNLGNIYENPSNEWEKMQNYISILNTYLFIIDNLNWDNIVRRYFSSEYNTTYTQSARQLIADLMTMMVSYLNRNYPNNNNNNSNYTNNNNNRMNI